MLDYMYLEALSELVTTGCTIAKRTASFMEHPEQQIQEGSFRRCSSTNRLKINEDPAGCNIGMEACTVLCHYVVVYFRWEQASMLWDDFDKV